MANGDMGLVGELLGSRHVDDRMCGKGADELAHGRVAAGLAEAVQPSGLKAFDPLCELLCLSCGSCRSKSVRWMSWMSATVNGSALLPKRRRPYVRPQTTLSPNN
jgi:hypothetical protein